MLEPWLDLLSDDVVRTAEWMTALARSTGTAARVRRPEVEEINIKAMVGRGSCCSHFWTVRELITGRTTTHRNAGESRGLGENGTRSLFAQPRQERNFGSFVATYGT